MKNLIAIILLIFILSSCSKETLIESNIKETKQDLEFFNTYKEGIEALEFGDPYLAAKKFLDAELLFPQSDWAPRAVLMASYAFYMQNYYAEAIFNLERFLITYPNNKDSVYAHYLIAMCYYETIEDEKRDSKPLFDAQKKFYYILNNYPSTDFAIDSEFKLNLIKDIIASKEMYIGRHYLKKKLWIAAINRFKKVMNDYDDTIFVEEAIHRLVETYYLIGLEEESKKYAAILGYNYQSSEWYKKSYKIFNQDYLEINDVIKKDKKGVNSIFKKLFD